MTSSTNRRFEPMNVSVPLWLQISAWLLGIAACIVGMLDLVAEWSPYLATIQFLLLVFAPVPFMLERKSRSQVEPVPDAKSATAIDWGPCLFSGGIALFVSASIGTSLGDLPPAYHDEYSYLFQARTLLAGRFSFPSASHQPELFDQMHVLNEGRMASRYYPGTGLWLAPFVAFGHPYWGQWFAGAIAVVLMYWTGKELGGRPTGIAASLFMALSPGIGLFANMLLAHHPTMLSLAVFLLGMTRWRRTRSAMDAGIASVGLSYAMLCRPMTAAGIGLPFGLDVLCWLIWTRRADARENAVPGNRRWAVILGLGIPLIPGWLVMLDYNHAVTGNWLQSPYQLYTDLYTPRHVFGFSNVVRGETRLGPKVIDSYDRWAQNLTPELAAENAINRLVCSWLWTFDFLPLLMTTAIMLGILRRLDMRWTLIGASILSLHAVHIPYWYVGIMGWHYVFETAPLWSLYLAATSIALFGQWLRTGKPGMIGWWSVFLAISLAGACVVPSPKKPSRFIAGLSSLAHPRRQHAEYRRWIIEQVDDRPALVLLEQGAMEKSHLDLVVNDPGLQSNVLFGRFRPGTTDVAAVQRDYPDRSLYIVNIDRRSIRKVPAE